MRLFADGGSETKRKKKQVAVLMPAAIVRRRRSAGGLRVVLFMTTRFRRAVDNSNARRKLPRQWIQLSSADIWELRSPDPQHFRNVHVHGRKSRASSVALDVDVSYSGRDVCNIESPESSLKRRTSMSLPSRVCQNDAADGACKPIGSKRGILNAHPRRGSVASIMRAESGTEADAAQWHSGRHGKCQSRFVGEAGARVHDHRWGACRCYFNSKAGF